MRKTVVIDTRSMEMMERMGTHIQESLDIWQSNVQPMLEFQARMLEAYAPVLQSISRMVKALQPFLEMQEKLKSYSEIAMPDLVVEAISIPVYPTKTRMIRRIEPIEEVTPKSLIQLPFEAEWKYLECRFRDGHTISVLYKDKLIGNFDHESLGFARKNTKDGKPDKQWELLKQLSIIYQHNTNFKPTVGDLAIHFESKKATLHKLKQSLADKLKSAFGITNDPFHSYDDQLGYQIRFKLRPEPDLRGDGQLYPSGSKFFDNTTDLDQD